jgi:two-component system CheB/CheR fusion protein
VLHLAADRESRLAELLQTATSMPVQQVNESAKVEPNHVYVIPPGKSLASADGFLHLTDLPSEPGKRVAVDLFFRTLADTHGPQATAIVLSGADGDGAIGIKRIKERGGLTIAQEPQEAEHSGMPRSAIATGMVDWVLPVAAMHDRVVRYQRVGERIALPPEEGPQPAKPRPITDAGEVALREVLTHLHNCTGHDFTYYKRATILRRIARRMKINEKEDLQDYLTTLRMTPGEATALLQDLLISVTNFFRDPEAFAALEAQLPTILAQRVGGEPIRAWVPACATGEEAYSIAILLAEAMQDLQLYQPFQIFATDLDEAAIRTAREGIYPATIAADVSEERLKRFFVKDLRGYRVKAELRESILFARHDLLRDSAFSRIDLLSCRNLMIYLDREAQERALDILHFSLKPGGRLFLGLSETAEHSNQFATIDKRHRIFMPRPASRTSLPIPLGQTSVARALALQRLERERPASTAARGPSWPLRDQGSVTRRRRVPGASCI